MNKNADLFCKMNCTLGEGPVWDSTRQRLYWVDIVEKKIHRSETSPKTKVLAPIELPEMIGCFAFRNQGGMIAALEHRLVLVDEQTLHIQTLAEVESDLPNNRFNDGKCDPKGRFLAGTMSKIGEAKRGSLYSIDSKNRVERRFEQIGISNGLCWNEKSDTFYFIDTALSSVQAFDYDLDTGKISNPRTLFTIDAKEGYPDGMTIDQEGMLWVAHWEGWQVSRWNPKTGKKIGQISVPASKVTSCVFGGPNMNQLFITTANFGIDAAGLAKEPDAGSVFVVELEVSGKPLHTFAG